MAGIIVVGAQWGDEGKGKVVDVFSSQSDMVVRYQGGANAGHTLIVNGQKTVLHLIPSGVLHPNTQCLVAAGVVLDIEVVWKEIQALRAAGLLQNNEQLKISDSCTVILKYHRMLDQAREAAAGNEKIGTTGKGIGPAYEDRAGRKAILFGDLFDPKTLTEKIEKALKEKNYLLKNYYKSEEIDAKALVSEVLKLAEQLKPYRCKDTSLLIHHALQAKKKVLFEGAQGTLLDLLHGTYPFVTSSSTLSGSACIGSGIGPTEINKVIGICKAYTTRVGSGPFPTELNDEVGERMCTIGKEFGSTTGRKRRTGWLDLPALKYAIRTNGITSIALMKIDVLSGFHPIKICMGYEMNGQKISEYPVSPGELAACKPIYKEFEGWDESIMEAKTWADLPPTTRSYIEFIAKEIGRPIDVVSVGPDRNQTLWLNPLF
jgi:adenylosuccinate synthase